MSEIDKRKVDIEIYEKLIVSIMIYVEGFRVEGFSL